MNSYELQVQDDWEKFSSKHSELFPNIVLLGATGSGKSSLINCVFDANVAPVAATSRGTEGFHVYKGRDYGLGVNLIDSRGYELGDPSGASFEQYRKDIEKAMRRNRQEGYLGKIHIVWYCISILGHRVQPQDIKTLSMLQQEPALRGRIAIVLTKSDEDDCDGTTGQTFREVLNEDLPQAPRVFDVSTDPELKLQLDDLIAWSADQLDQTDCQDAQLDMKEAFVAGQVQNLQLKKSTASRRIAVYAATAAGIGAAPIPIAAAAVLTPLQVTMAAHITRIYGLDSFGNISSALLGDVVVANLGKAFAGGLLKLIPGGQIVGGIINAGVASSITYAVGEAISTICYRASERIAGGEPVDFKEMFNVTEIKKLVAIAMKAPKKQKR